MDFFETNNAPFAVTIFGTNYLLPRIRNPQLKGLSAILRKLAGDDATSHIADAEQKYRYKAYMPVPPQDIADVLFFASSPDGAEYVADFSMKEAGVPDEVREKVLATANPMLLRDLAKELTKAPEILANLGADKGADPLPPPPGESGGSHGIGVKTPPDSQQSTAA